MSTNANDNVVRISGAGSVAGGVYREVTVSGSGRITSRLECETLRVSGTLVCEGPVKAGSIKVSGTASFAETVDVGSATISGTSSFQEGLTAGDLHVSGSVDVKGGIRGGSVALQGGLRVGRDCEVETFRAEGAFSVGGLLSADYILVRMHGPCKAREVGGESVEFRQARLPWREIAAALGLTGLTGLQAESVEGDHVLLQRAKVASVRGGYVELGDGCEIDLVEYRDELKQARSAHVKTVRKTEGAPAGQ